MDNLAHQLPLPVHLVLLPLALILIAVSKTVGAVRQVRGGSSD
eukprot:COSAG05_NODE_17581_length_323_cov_0.665179_1_plen_42_part_01